MENIRIINEAGKRVKPVSNAFSLVTCCRKTGMMKRNPARGICWMMELITPIQTIDSSKVKYQLMALNSF